MRFTEGMQRAYRADLARLEDEAADYVEAYMTALRASSPNASVAELREAAKEAIGDALNAFGDQAGTLACELFDRIVEQEGIKAESQLYDAIDPAMLNEKVHFYAKQLVDGNGPGFQDRITDLTRFYVKRTAYENMVRNCSKNRIRYARVPSGRETCAFCFMLSSRGFVYHSELTARGRSLHGMHDHCDCIIVPGIPGETEIDGYDPDLMYARWKQCAETVGVDPSKANSFKYRNKVMNEVSKRDFKWLNSPDPDYRCSITIEDGAKPKKKEWIVADRLASMGFDIGFLKPIGKAGKHTADATLNGVRWEFKQPKGDEAARKIGKNTIDHQFEEASKQSRRIVLDITCIEEYDSVGTEAAITKSRELFSGKWRASFDELLIFSKKGLFRYKNA